MLPCSFILVWYHLHAMVLQSTPEKLLRGADSASAHRLALYPAADDSSVPLVSFKRQLHPPPGPRSQLEWLQWPAFMWQHFTPRQRSQLISFLTSWQWSDYFSGIGARDQIIAQIAFEVNRHVAEPIVPPRTYCVVELDAARQQFLSSFSENHRSLHSCSDIVERLGVDHRRRIAEMTAPPEATIYAKKVSNLEIADYIHQRYRDRGWSHSFAHCLRHDCQCPVVPRVLSSLDKTGETIDLDGLDVPDSEEPQYFAVSGGPPCRDASAMNVHASGDGGPNFLATATFLQEFNWSHPDICFVECTKRWSASLVADQLPTHCTQRFLIDGTMTGDVYKRERMGCFSFNPDKFCMAPSLDEFLLCAEQFPVFDASDFWCTDREDELRELREWKHRRHVMVPDEQLAWLDVLLPSQRERLDDYHWANHRRVAEGSCKAGTPFVADLDQSPAAKRGRMTLLVGCGIMPTSIQHGCLWHSSKKQVLTALDGFRMHAWPITSLEQRTVGSVFSCMSDVRGMLLHQELDHKTLTQTTGDSWHIRYQGCLLMFIMASLNPLPQTVPRCLSREGHSPGHSDAVGSPPKRARHCDADDESPGPPLTHNMLPITVDDSDGETTSHYLHLSLSAGT